MAPGAPHRDGRRRADVDVVWAETPEFVVIRNMNMCGCPPDFVAGLALPRARITGIEDPKRPDAIWPLAWDVARTRIADALGDYGILVVRDPAGGFLAALTDRTSPERYTQNRCDGGPLSSRE